MVKKLLAPKREGLHPDYERGYFERLLARGLRHRALASGSSRAPACCTSRRPRADDHRRSGAQRPEPAAPRSRRGRRSGRYLDLAVLWTFAVAQPLFDLLSDNPEFFAARGSTGFD